MVQLSSPVVKSHKITKTGKKTPKKSSAVDTPTKTQVKTLKMVKNSPTRSAAEQTPKTKKSPKTLTVKKAALIEKEKSTPKVAALKSPKTLKVKKAAIGSEKNKSTPNVAPITLKNGTASVKKTKKAKAPKQDKVAEDVEMASEVEEKVASAKVSSKKSSPVKSGQHKTAGEFCVFVRGLNYNSEQDTVFKHFQQFGTLKRCSIPRNRDNTKQVKGFCFIEYNSQEDMDKALAAAHMLDSRTLQVSVNKPPTEAAGKRKRDESQQPRGGNKRHATKFENQLFVARLKYTTSRNSIQEHFSQFGEVVDVALPMKSKTENKGFAFVAFKEASSLKKALAQANHEIDSANIVLSADKKPAAKEEAPRPINTFLHELFVGGLNPSTEKATLQQHFGKYGKVVNITLPWNKEDSRNKGFAFVAFESADSLNEACEEDHEIDGKTIGVRVGKKKEENGAASKKPKSKEVKVSPAFEKMEEDSEEEVEGEEGDSEGDEEVEGEEADSDEEGEEADSDEEVEGEEADSDEEGVEADSDEEVEGEEAESENGDEEGDSDEGEAQEEGDDDDEDESDEDEDDEE